MSNLLWKSLVVSPAVLGATLLISTSAIAAQKSTSSGVTNTEVSPAKNQEASTSASVLANTTAVTELAQNPVSTSSTAVTSIAQNPVSTSSTAVTELAQNPVSTSSTAVTELAQNPVSTSSTAVTSIAQNPVSTSSTTVTKLAQNPVSTSSTAVTSIAQNPVSTSSTAVTKIAQKLDQKSEKIAQAQQRDVNVLQQVNNYSNEGQNSQSQVTSVSQFSDVQPTDWAFQSLQSLVERYGCIAGYPNGTFRGNRALTRYEFAAGLNACLDRVNELIATATSNVVRKEDLATLQRLQEEFSAELATLRGRVDALESRTAELQANQFSTTTKLVGEAIFALSDTLGDNNAGKGNHTVLQDRVRLDLQTSFTGQDVLHTRLATGNGRLFNLGVPGVGPRGGSTSEGTQTFQINGAGTGGLASNNNIALDWLSYYFPVGPAQVYISATGGTHSDYAATLHPYFEDYDGGNGALSTFASRNPIYDIGGGAGGAVSFKFGKGGLLKPSSLTVGYLASNPNNPSIGQGVFNGNYAALGQLNFNVTNRVALAATYVHGYHQGGTSIFDEGGILNPTAGTTGVNNGLNNGVVGTAQANQLTGPAESNSYGVEGTFRLTNKVSLSGFGTYTDVSGKVYKSDDFQAWTYGGGIAFSDLGKKGNVLGLFAGAEPYALNRRGFGGSSVPLHVEGFYKYRLSDNISITPGIIYLTSPGQSSNNDDAVIGTLRTTFTF